MNTLKGHTYSEYRILLNNWNDTQIAKRWRVAPAKLGYWKAENGIFITHTYVKRLKIYKHIRKLQKLGYSFDQINRLTQLCPSEQRQLLEDYEGVE
ncbi:hypothetical protein EP56_02185 [Listeriaceae bacterium FSL A5-0209]|nr:hypothetical protein EP56_02185 [Listeriaceae bacterium FSL A5-0209]